MKPIKSIVYLPVNVERHRNHHIFDLNECEGSFIQNVAEERGYFFTSEQLNEYTAKVGKAFLENAAKKAQTIFIEDECPLTGEEFEIRVVNKQSITNTFEETYQKLKV